MRNPSDPSHASSVKEATPASPCPGPELAVGCWPKANGQSISREGAADGSNAEILHQFAVAYGRLNQLSTELTRIRTDGRTENRAEKERRKLQEIEEALRQRDALEDRYATRGIWVEPVMQHGLAVDLQCRFGNAQSDGSRRAEWVTITAALPIPLPAQADLSDYLVRVELPASLRTGPPTAEELLD